MDGLWLSFRGWVYVTPKSILGADWRFKRFHNPTTSWRAPPSSAKIPGPSPDGPLLDVYGVQPPPLSELRSSSSLDLKVPLPTLLEVRAHASMTACQHYYSLHLDDPCTRASRDKNQNTLRGKSAGKRNGYSPPPYGLLRASSLEMMKRPFPDRMQGPHGTLYRICHESSRKFDSA